MNSLLRLRNQFCISFRNLQEVLCELINSATLLLWFCDEILNLFLFQKVGDVDDAVEETAVKDGIRDGAEVEQYGTDTISSGERNAAHFFLHG